MNVKANRKRFVKTLVSIMCIGILFLLIMYGTEKSGERLSKQEIAKLRLEYPICGDTDLVLGSMRTPEMEEIKEIRKTFVYGQVEGDMSTYSEYVSTGNSQLDEKRRNNGISDVFDFYEYTISVIDDTDGIYDKGDKIKIVANTDFIDYNPQLSDGMKIVVPIIEEDLESANCYYNVYGMYYVTDSEYAISAFDENKAMMRKTMSGVKVEQLMEELKR